MKLNPEIVYVTRQHKKCGDMLERIKKELPDEGCLRYPSVFAVLHEGVYYMVKYRGTLAGEPCYDDSEPVDPYTLEFVEHTLLELRRVCNPSTGYKLPEGFIGSNILVKF